MLRACEALGVRGGAEIERPRAAKALEARQLAEPPVARARDDAARDAAEEPGSLTSSAGDARAGGRTVEGCAAGAAAPNQTSARRSGPVSCLGLAMGADSTKNRAKSP